MKFDTQKAFPYPVLRPNADDLVGSDIQSTPYFDIDHDERTVKFATSIDISSEYIYDLIDSGKAHFAVEVACRATFFRQTIKSQVPQIESSFDYDGLRDEVEITSYILATTALDDYMPDDLNPEFGNTPFKLEKGDVLAVDEPRSFYFDRDSFKPLASIFSLVMSDNLTDNEWKIDLEEQTIRILVNHKTKSVIDIARNDKTNKAILLNSLWFTALTEALRGLAQSPEDYSENQWAKALNKRIHNLGNVELGITPPYEIAQVILNKPFVQLVNYAFKEEK